MRRLTTPRAAGFAGVLFATVFFGSGSLFLAMVFASSAVGLALVASRSGALDPAAHTEVGAFGQAGVIDLHRDGGHSVIN